MFASIRGKRVFGLVVLLTATIWPAIYNSTPFYYYDTIPYMRRADAAVNRLTGLKTPWTLQEKENSSKAAPFETNSAAGNQAIHQGQGSNPAPRGGVLYLGRSIFYGLLLYLGTADQFFWLSILLQGAAIILALWLLLRLQEIPVWPAILWLGLPLCFLSDVSFFVSFLMPDLFAGIAILVCASLFAAERPLRTHEAVAAWFLLSAGLLFHDSIPVVVALTSISFLGWNVARWSRTNWRQHRLIYAVLLCAFLTSAAGRTAYVMGAEHLAGYTPVRLPFLSSHLIQGPGATYLHSTCPNSGFALCEFVDQFPESSEIFLWSQHGGFTATNVSLDLKKRLSKEDLRFTFAVFRDSPLRFLGFIGHEVMLETVSFSLVDFLYDPDPKRQFDFYVPPPARAAIQRSPAYTGTIPIAALSILNYVFVTAALVFLAGRRTIRYTVSPENRRKWKLAAWIIFGVLFNALVCGAVSIPLPRYEARVIWVIPLAALLFVADDLAKRMKARTRNVAMKSAA